ncbi:MAG: 2-keto-4-pentenoate hydratase [Minwuia sp.]|uniref:2-keto-4-pentenoate hydratase n=1 Tax=Minwuia sp. TaxID=2493630 RepID=UPI003A85C235
MDISKQKELARLLAGFRRYGTAQSGLDPALVPPDPATAYRIAAMVEEELGWEVAGWKIAAFKQEMQRQLRTDAPIYGRVYAPLVMAEPVTRVHADCHGPIPEVEFEVKLGRDLPPRDAPYSTDEVMDAVESIHPGFELAECRFVHDDNFPPLPAILADGAGSGVIAYGPAIENWRDADIAGQEVKLFRNGELCRSGTAAEHIDHPVVPVTWLANELSRTGVGMKAGQMVSSGTLTGMLQPKPGDTFVADFGPFGTVTANYV